MVSQLQLRSLMSFNQVIVFVSLLAKFVKKEASFRQFLLSYFPSVFSSKQYTIWNNNRKKIQSKSKRVSMSFFWYFWIFLALKNLVPPMKKIPKQEKKKSQMQNRFIQILKFLLVLEEKHIMLIQNHQLEARYFFFVLLFSL